MVISLKRPLIAAAFLLAFISCFAASPALHAQKPFGDEILEDEGADLGDEVLDEEALDEEPDVAEEGLLDEDLPEDELAPPLEREFGEVIEGLEPGEIAGRWKIKINAAIRANYVFNDSPDSFIIKYSWEIEGQANADTAVIRGDANIRAEVDGFLAKWPTGECSLDVTIPKVPFEMTFRKSGEEKGNIALKFRKNILENWQSKCTFTDAPGARFETSGDPEKWLALAIQKARPPLRSIVTDVTDEETTTSFVINKDILEDPPLGTIEIEGTGVITITPGTAPEEE